jgi:SAM-dependent methyltransferase
VARWVGYGGGRQTQTVHRALIDPRAGGRPTPTRLHDLLIEWLPPRRNPRVLDAGCGMGGTMLDLAARRGGDYVGVTLSESQAAIGRRAIARAGLDHRVRVLVQSYDDPPAGPFDAIIAIESLAHSRHPAVSVTALARQLAPGGVIAIVDDMPQTAHDRDIDTFKHGWRCPVLFSRDQYRAVFGALGLELIADHDLSSSVVSRSLTRILWLERLNRLARAAPLPAWRMMLDSYHGGLALERLYRRRLMQYRLLVARAPQGR